MSVEACVELVKTRDQIRYKSAMSAPRDVQPDLFALYAFNAEIVNSAWAARDPMLGEMRLQYWHDQIEALFTQGAVDGHPVLNALRQSNRINMLPMAYFQDIIAARRWDLYSDAFDDTANLRGYLTDTSGKLMVMAALLHGMEDQHQNAVLDYGYASGLAAFFVAMPELKARGHTPLPDESPEAIQALAKDALDLIKATRTKPHRLMRIAQPALQIASEAEPILRRAYKDPARVLSGTLPRAPIQENWRRLYFALLGKW